jgi:hypothetical protein
MRLRLGAAVPRPLGSQRVGFSASEHRRRLTPGSTSACWFNPLSSRLRRSVRGNGRFALRRPRSSGGGELLAWVGSGRLRWKRTKDESVAPTKVLAQSGFRRVTGDAGRIRGSGPFAGITSPAGGPYRWEAGVGFTRPAPAFSGSEVKNSPPCFIGFEGDRRLNLCLRRADQCSNPPPR